MKVTIEVRTIREEVIRGGMIKEVAVNAKRLGSKITLLEQVKCLIWDSQISFLIGSEEPQLMEVAVVVTIEEKMTRKI